MQDQKGTSSPNKKRNLIVIGVILLLIAALLAASRLARPAGTLPEGPLPSAAPSATDDPMMLSTAVPGQEESGDVTAFLLISVRGSVQRVEPLDEDRDVEITQPTGEKNVIHISHGSFHMASSTCDNQLCIGQGEVTAENYTRRILGPYVLCLPNQVELQLVIPGATPPPDAPDI